MTAILIYVTCEDEKEALKIANSLVSSGAVACANVIPQTMAVFKWEGFTQEKSEAILILKSQKDRLEEVMERIKQIHSYDLPCILTMQIEGGDTKFLEWILSNSTRSQ